MAESKLFYVGIKALIKNERGEILVLKASLRDHSKGAEPYWDIPGGRIDEGESPLETLHREIVEETGITQVSKEAFYTAVISHHQVPVDKTDPDSKKAGLALMIYTVEIPPHSTILLSPEHVAYEWLSAPEAAKRLTNKYPAEFTDILAKSS